jgi:hypothetical protein
MVALTTSPPSRGKTNLYQIKNATVMPAFGTKLIAPAGFFHSSQT